MAARRRQDEILLTELASIKGEPGSWNPLSMNDSGLPPSGE